jgi:virulence-associated protein VagC
MAVVRVDAHRRIYVPKEIEIDSDKVVLVRQGAALLVIPVPRNPIEIDVKEPVPGLKAKAESLAKDDARRRAKRRGR